MIDTATGRERRLLGCGHCHLDLLTYARNSTENRDNDDPVILGPQHPTAVGKDKFTRKIRECHVDTGSNDGACQVCKSLNPSGILEWCSAIA